MLYVISANVSINSSRNCINMNKHITYMSYELLSRFIVESTELLLGLCIAVMFCRMLVHGTLFSLFRAILPGTYTYTSMVVS